MTDERVCVCLSPCLVCLSVSVSPELYFRSAPISFVHVTYNSARSYCGGVVILVCASGFVNDVMFVPSGQE